MESIGKRIKKFRTLKDISQKELAEKIGISNKRLSNWERGLSKPNTEMLEKICKALEVDYYELIDVEFEMETFYNYYQLFEDYINADDLKFQEYYINQAFLERVNALDIIGKKFLYRVLEHEEKRMKQIDESNTKTISHPLFNLPASAGTGQFLDSGEYELVEFPEEVVPRDSNFAVKVSGDSMEPDYPNGSVVFVKQVKSINPGEVGIFIVNGEGYLKKLGNSGELISINPEYEDIKIGKYDNCKIVGKVVGNYNEF